MRCVLNKKVKDFTKTCFLKIRSNALLVGILSLVWLIFRSGTKPTRIQYPCQKAAASNLGLLFLFLPYNALHKLHWRLKNNFRWADLHKIICIIGVSLVIIVCFDYAVEKYTVYQEQRIFLQTSKMGPIGKILPGGEYSVIPPALNLPSPHRVVSVHSSAATSWPESDSSSSYANTINCMDQEEINRMVERGVKELTGASNLLNAWNALIPYNSGEAVAIKLNFNNVYVTSRMNPYPHLINSIIDGLLSIGVPPNKIWLTDPSRPINDGMAVVDIFKSHIVNKNVVYIGQGDEEYAANNSADATISVMHDGFEVPINPSLVFCNAAHIINVPQLKGHGGASITLGLKNHFGSISITRESSGANSDPPTHSYFYGYSNTSRANLLADINDNPVFKNKTRLVVGSGLMGHPTANWSAPVVWNTFGNKPPEILFFGVDPVAIDSVMFDYLQAEAGNRTDGILHYAANIGLGVHEHWNTSTDKRYSVIDYIEIDFDRDQSDPQAYFNVSAQSGFVPLTIHFNASQSFDPNADIAQYNWDFGDGSTGSGINVSHTYNFKGEYLVRLTVITDKNTQHSSHATIYALESIIPVQAESSLRIFNNILNEQNAQVLIRAVIDVPCKLALNIFDNRGKEIICLFYGYKDAGVYDFSWNGIDLGGRKVGSGVYMVHMKTGSYSKTKKIVVVK